MCNSACTICCDLSFPRGLPYVSIAFLRAHQHVEDWALIDEDARILETEEDAREWNEWNGKIPPPSEVNSVTIGAATAMAMKSSNGGLKSLQAHMAKLLQQDPPHPSCALCCPQPVTPRSRAFQNRETENDDLWLLLDIDTLSLELSKRTLMVMSQALCGMVTSAAVEVAGHIAHRDWGALTMISSCGLLVHWVSAFPRWPGWALLRTCLHSYVALPLH